MDASLTGLGGVWANRVYASPIIQLTQFDLKIVHLEMLNILVALRIWKIFWIHSTVRIFCDNKAVVQVAESGKLRIHIWLPVLEIYGFSQQLMTLTSLLNTFRVHTTS